MGRLLARIGVRGAVAGGLTVLVVLTAAIARVAGGAGEPAWYSSDTRTAATVGPTEGDDGEVEPPPSRYFEDENIRAAASNFAAIWLKRDLNASEWHTRVSRVSTQELSERLRGVDPSDVPATRMTAGPSIVLISGPFAIVAIPVDTGTLRLTLLRQDRRWLVDGVDWERA